jgi:hypothetical protein
MGTLIKKEFKTHNAKQFIESLDETSNSIYYVFTGKPQTFTEASTPTPTDSIANAQYQVWDEMISGKQITTSDVKHMLEKNTWATNTAYQAYDDHNGSLNGSDYHAVTSEGSDFHVWKCIANNQSSGNSTSKPLYSDVSSSLNTLYLKTDDGYQWRFMYTITGTNNTKFTTTNYIPYIAHTNASTNAVSGSLDAYIVTNSGNNYNEFCNGTFTTVTNSTSQVLASSDFTLSTNNDFFVNCAIYIKSGTGAGGLNKITDYVGSSKTITLESAWDTNPSTSDSVFEITPSVTLKGDGSNATARALVNTSSNTIANVEVVTRGSGYTYVDATIEANNMASANVAAVRAPVAPTGGHGFDPINELEASHVGISVELANTESSNIPTDNDFRQIGIIKNPKHANVQLNGIADGTWTTGELVTQANTTSHGYVISANSSSVLLANVVGHISVGNSTNHANLSGGTSSATMNVTSLFVNTTEAATINVSNESQRSSFITFDQRHIFKQNLGSASAFNEDEKIVQDDTSANAFVYFANTSKVSATSVKGTFNIATDNVVTGATTSRSSKLTAQTNPDLVRNAGDIIYLNNIDAVSRSNTTTEIVRLVITF